MQRKSCEKSAKKLLRESLGERLSFTKKTYLKRWIRKENVPSVQQTIQNIFPYERRLEDGEFLVFLGGMGTLATESFVRIFKPTDTDP